MTTATKVSIKPLEDRVVVQANEAETTTASGLVIPDTAKEKPQEGTVIATGPGRFDEAGEKRIPLDVKTALFREILKYPPLVRKELTTNLLVSDTAPVELIRVAHQEMGGVLTRDQITEVVLFTTLKRVWQAERQRTHRTVAKS